MYKTRAQDDVVTNAVVAIVRLSVPDGGVLIADPGPGRLVVDVVVLDARGAREVDERDVDALALARLDAPRTLVGAEAELLRHQVGDEPLGLRHADRLARRAQPVLGLQNCEETKGMCDVRETCDVGHVVRDALTAPDGLTRQLEGIHHNEAQGM